MPQCTLASDISVCNGTSSISIFSLINTADPRAILPRRMSQCVGRAAEGGRGHNGAGVLRADEDTGGDDLRSVLYSYIQRMILHDTSCDSYCNPIPSYPLCVPQDLEEAWAKFTSDQLYSWASAELDTVTARNRGTDSATNTMLSSLEWDHDISGKFVLSCMRSLSSHHLRKPSAIIISPNSPFLIPQRGPSASSSQQPT